MPKKKQKNADYKMLCELLNDYVIETDDDDEKSDDAMDFPIQPQIAQKSNHTHNDSHNKNAQKINLPKPLKTTHNFV